MNPASMIHRLKTKISTPQYEETRKFYEKVMGFSLVEAWNDPNDTGCIFKIADGAHLEIYEGVAAGVDGVSLQFRVADLNQFHEIISALWPVGDPVDRPWGSTYLYLTDPAGVSIIVFEGAN